MNFLKDLTEKIGSGATPRGGKNAYQGGNFSLIRSQNVLDFQFSFDGLAKINDEQAKALSNVEVLDGDVLLNITGDSVARCCQVDAKSLPARVNQHVCIIRPKQDKLDARYLKYLLLEPNYKNFLLTLASAGATRNALTKGMVEELEIPQVDVTYQKAIAHILGTLDEKIELNQKMNQTLEDIAKAIFKSWFVDFDPVRAKAEGRPTGLPPDVSDLFPDELVDSEIGEIPKGWDIAPLDQIGNFRNGLAMQKYPAMDGEEQLPVVKIAQLRKGSTDGDDLFASGVPSDFIIADGDYVFSWSGSLMAKYWVGGKGALNQHLFKVEEKTQPLWFIAGWVEHFMPEFQSIAESKATTMGHIKREHLKQAICVIPSQELIKRSAEVITPLIERSILSQQESKVISELRDTLLPKLISGELRIPDAEKFLEEAGI